MILRAPHVFIFGLLIFFLAKGLLVLGPSSALGIPRLGDDALVYLWKASPVSYAPQGSPALRDLGEQTRFATAGWENERITLRLFGHITPAFDPLLRACLSYTHDLRQAFTLIETLGVLLMGAAMGWLLYELVGAGAAGFGMMIMAFAILPNQGIYAFIPSTFALSGALILWAYLWRTNIAARPWIVLALALPLPWLHPIGKIYLALAPVIYWYRLGGGIPWSSPALLRVAGITAVALAGGWLMPLLVIQPTSGIMGGIDISSGFVNNVQMAQTLIWDPIVRKNLLWAALLILAIWGTLARRDALRSPIGPLLAGSVLLLILSFTFWLPGYPAELFSRFWVLVFLLTAGAAGRYAWRLSCLPGRSGLMGRIALILGLALATIHWSVQYVPETMNWRNEVLDEALLRKEFARIPEDTTLLYADTTVSMQASLLLGGQRLGAIAHTPPSPIQTKLIESRQPDFIVALADPRLNSLAEAKARHFSQRRLGLYFPHVSAFTLTRLEGVGSADARTIWLRLDGNAAARLTWQAKARDGSLLGQGEAAIDNGPIGLAIPPGSAALHVNCPDAPIWLTGMGAGAPRAGLDWPWNEGWRLEYTLRHKRKPPVIVDFTPAALLARAEAADLVPLVAPGNPVHADAGGLVFLRTRFRQP